MHTALLLAAIVLTTALTSCTNNSDVSSSAGDGTIAVSSTEDACDVSASEATAGTLTFDITNDGSQVTEFYLLAEDGLRIVGEAENIGPGTSKKLSVDASPGSYLIACKPGMTGEGIRSEFTVIEGGESEAPGADEQAQIDEPLESYAAYVKDQSGELLEKTSAFVELYTAGDQDDEARALYPEARAHWERIETVAESFGDLDPKMDLREADLEPGARWTGWHLLEKDLWPARAGKYRALTPQQRVTYAQDLLKNTRDLDTRVQDLTYSVDQIANGSRGLLEEVATGKVTGEEEYWSHTDLYDFQANVDGARVGFEGLEPIVEQRDPELADTLTQRFEELKTLLDAQRQGDGFTLYTDLTPDEIRGLSDAVNALSEPLSLLTAAVVS